MTSRSNRRCAALVALLFACLSVGAFAQDAKKSTTKPSASAQKAHDQILKAYGVYGDQALQDYVAEVGQRVARTILLDRSLCNTAAGGIDHEMQAA